MFNTIHIFGFGETQMIGKDKNGKVKNSELTKLNDFVNHIKGFKPADVQDSDIHVIHLFKDHDVRYIGKGNGDITVKTYFSVKWEDVDATTLNELVSEIDSKIA